jgi:molybdopterin synthase catalytic subunit
MKIGVLYFGLLKDLAGCSADTIELPEGSRVQDLLWYYAQKSASWAEIVSSTAIAVNQQYAHLDDPLADGDEVGILPPVSGGSAASGADASSESPAWVRIVREPIEVEALASQLKLPADGAAVVFEGVVRDQTRGRQTLYLDYESYEEMALKQMHSLAAEAKSRFSVRAVCMVHRLGRLEIGETSVLVVVASAHRGPAFDACRWLIDTLKKTVPIWKKEYFVDGAVWAQGEPFPEEIRSSAGTTGGQPAS